jgi:hypothetical protein
VYNNYSNNFRNNNKNAIQDSYQPNSYTTESKWKNYSSKDNKPEQKLPSYTNYLSNTGSNPSNNISSF